MSIKFASCCQHLRRTISTSPTSSPPTRSISTSLCQPQQQQQQVSWASEETNKSSTGWNAPRNNGEKKKKNNSKKPMPRIIHHLPKELSPQEQEKRRLGRILRAERLERKDLTAQMTLVKTYMGGFTQPQHLHYLNTLDPTRKIKDSYDVRVGENRVKPLKEAYEPHTVYLAVTRYPIRWGHGRSTRREVFTGFCKESLLVEKFKELNYATWKPDETKWVKLRHGKPKEPIEIPGHWYCPPETKDYLDKAVFPGSPEERSYLNKPISVRIKAIQKEIQQERERLDNDKDDTTSSPELTKLERLLSTTIQELHPRVDPESYSKPLPPYLSPRLIVPLLTVTFPTRPLASTIARLCNSHPRGLPFISSIPDQDRKDGSSTFRRLLRMRSNRLFELTKELVLKLKGHQGGLMSLRLNHEDKGRGIEGEGLGKELQQPKGGWARICWLNRESEIWKGIERESYLESWKFDDNDNNNVEEEGAIREVGFLQEHGAIEIDESGGR